MALPAWAIPAGIQLGSTVLGGLFGGKQKTQAAVPDDLQPMRQHQIGLMNYLLGFGPDPRVGMAQQARQQAGAFPGQQAALQKMAGKKGVMGKAGKKALAANSAAQQQAQWALQQFGGLPGLASGGMVYGPGGPTDDMIPTMLSNGEGVLNTAAVEKIGGPEIIHLLNQLGMLDENGQFRGMSPFGEKPSSPFQAMNTGGIVGGANSLLLPQQQKQAMPQPTQLPVSMGPEMEGLSGPAVMPNINTQGTGGGQVPQQGGGMMTPQQRLESFFGPLGITPSNLQNAGTNALTGMLNQPSPEQRAAEITMPQLQQNLTGNPQTQAATNALMGLQTGAGADVEGRLGQIGQRPITGFGNLDQILQQMAGGFGGNMAQAQSVGPSGLGIPELQRLASQNAGIGVMEALDPTFQRNLAAANQTGGRFGSGNAILRSRAVDDFNLQSANALQRGVDQQTAAASALGQLGLGGDNVRLGSAELNLRGQLGNAGNQLGALQLATSGSQGLDTSALQALGQLGGFRLQGQGQQAQNLQAAGNLGLGQGQLGNQAAQTIGQMAGQQGQADLNRAQAAFGAGTVNTQMENQGQQRAIDLLLQQLMTAQGATLGGPVTQTPSGAQQGAQLGGDLAQLIMMSQYLGGKGGG